MKGLVRLPDTVSRFAADLGAMARLCSRGTITADVLAAAAESAVSQARDALVDQGVSEIRTLTRLYRENAVNAASYLAGVMAAALQRSQAVTIEEVKAYLRLRMPAGATGDDGGDTEVIAGLIDAAVQYVEDATERTLLTATWQYSMGAFPGQYFTTLMADTPQVKGWPLTLPYGFDVLPEAMEIVLPRPPLQSVKSIVYVDTTGTQQTLDPTLYQVDTTTWLGRVAPAYSQVWPVAQLQYNSVVVTYTAGYGNGGGAIPGDLRRVILALVALYYTNRGASQETGGAAGVGNLIEVPYGVQQVLMRHKVEWAR